MNTSDTVTLESNLGRKIRFSHKAASLFKTLGQFATPYWVRTILDEDIDHCCECGTESLLETCLEGLNEFDDADRIAAWREYVSGISLCASSLKDPIDCSILIGRSSKSTCVNLEGALDLPVTVSWDDLVLQGHVTLVPGANERLRPYGESLDTWISGLFLKYIRRNLSSEGVEELCQDIVLAACM